MPARPAHRFIAAFALLALACAGETQNEAPPAPPAATPAPAPAALSLADVAGRWRVDVMPENSDSTILTYELMATADGQGWMIMFPDRADHVPMQARVDGDSIIAQAGPFPSALRADVNVSTTSSMRLENGQLVGMTTARYETTGADSVTVLRTRGTRIQ